MGQELQSEIAQRTAQVDELTTKINTVAKKKSEADEKLRGLTVVSSNMAKYKEMTNEALQRELTKTNKAFSKFEHVNKKAIDQFTTFSDQLQSLEKRKQEIEESRKSIEDLIRTVDELKEETLMQTLQ